mmetsp:Transcript_36386/g.81714  ORF Transcript_36386/g.81714 Transcript_36386/m.81714 type:complete len:221 (-) Transcript_36386:296-958(-)
MGRRRLLQSHERNRRGQALLGKRGHLHPGLLSLVSRRSGLHRSGGGLGSSGSTDGAEDAGFPEDCDPIRVVAKGRGGRVFLGREAAVVADLAQRGQEEVCEAVALFDGQKVRAHAQDLSKTHTQPMRLQSFTINGGAIPLPTPANSNITATIRLRLRIPPPPGAATGAHRRNRGGPARRCRAFRGGYRSLRSQRPWQDSHVGLQKRVPPLSPPRGPVPRD